MLSNYCWDTNKDSTQVQDMGSNAGGLFGYHDKKNICTYTSLLIGAFVPFVGEFSLYFGKKQPWLIIYGQLKQFPPACYHQRLCEKMSNFCRAKVVWSLHQIAASALGRLEFCQSLGDRAIEGKLFQLQKGEVAQTKVSMHQLGLVVSSSKEVSSSSARDRDGSKVRGPWQIDLLRAVVSLGRGVSWTCELSLCPCQLCHQLTACACHDEDPPQL
jgi:hypothetical protein